MSAAPTLVVIGGGPRGTGVIERIAANARELYGDLPLDIHLVDPYPAGGRARLAAGPAPLALDELHGRGRHHVHRRDGGAGRTGRRGSPHCTPGPRTSAPGRVTPDAEPAVLADRYAA
ncbi:Adenylate cyclase OS=Streptomyces microflavus OX=1919 GN=Smic_14240 PE=4 SV=1 [Streptomyces microflavus]